jgi:hypothetical protein
VGQGVQARLGCSCFARSESNQHSVPFEMDSVIKDGMMSASTRVLVNRANERTGKWLDDEDSKLKDAVQMHRGKNRDTIAALVPGRAISQCRRRWQVLTS